MNGPKNRGRSLTWFERLERIPGFKSMLTAAVAVAMAAWGIFTRLDGIIIFTLILVASCAALLLFILILKAVPYIRHFLAPTLKMHVPLINYATSNFSIDDKKLSALGFEIHVLNTSHKHRVSLHFPLVILGNPSSGDRSEIMNSVNTTNIKTNLGPEEETSGLVTVNFVDRQTGNAGITLVIEDRLTGRVARMGIPGKYPRENHG